MSAINNFQDVGKISISTGLRLFFDWIHILSLSSVTTSWGVQGLKVKLDHKPDTS